MRLLTHDPQLLEWGGRSGWLLVGLGLLIAGLFFGVLPLLLFRRSGSAAHLVLAASGIPLLLGGLWAMGYRQQVRLDARARTLTVLRGNILTATPETVGLDRIGAVGILQRNYVSRSGNTAHTYWTLVFRLADGERIEIHDQDVSRDLERTRSLGRAIADLLGVPLDAQPGPPP